MSFKMHGDANQVYITNPNAFRPANNEVRIHVSVVKKKLKCVGVIFEKGLKTKFNF